MGAREVMRRVRDGYRWAKRRNHQLDLEKLNLSKSCVWYFSSTRLERPAHCHPDLYLIIQKCWAGDMNKRPDFSELRKEIAKLLEDQHGQVQDDDGADKHGGGMLWLSCTDEMLCTKSQDTLIMLFNNWYKPLVYCFHPQVHRSSKHPWEQILLNGSEPGWGGEALKF